MSTVSIRQFRTRALPAVLATVVLPVLPWAFSPGLLAGDKASPGAGLFRSAHSGPWSAPATWEGGKVPDAGARVQVRPGHTVPYDKISDRVIRSVHVAGTLRFPPDRDTRLDVGLIKVQPGDDPDENG